MAINCNKDVREYAELGCHKTYRDGNPRSRFHECPTADTTRVSRSLGGNARGERGHHHPGSRRRVLGAQDENRQSPPMVAPGPRIEAPDAPSSLLVGWQDASPDHRHGGTLVSRWTCHGSVGPSPTRAFGCAHHRWAGGACGWRTPNRSLSDAESLQALTPATSRTLVEGGSGHHRDRRGYSTLVRCAWLAG